MAFHQVLIAPKDRGGHRQPDNDWTSPDTAISKTYTWLTTMLYCIHMMTDRCSSMVPISLSWLCLENG